LTVIGQLATLGQLRNAGNERKSSALRLITDIADSWAMLAYARTLHARDNYPMLDDYGCYLLIASAATALHRARPSSINDAPKSRRGIAWCARAADA
jgi:hypothetical protein